MDEISLRNLMIVAAVAFGLPLLLGFAPKLRLPAVVLEIVAGIVLGPSVLGLVEVDLPIEVLALLGLGFLLFLAGLEIEFEQLRGANLRLSLLSFGLSLGIALLLSYGLAAAGVLDAPLFVAIMLSATALGVVIGVLKDSGQISRPFGQLVLVAASIADFATVILLALFFSRGESGPLTQIVLLGALALLALVIGLGVLRAERSTRLAIVLERLQDSTAQIRVRGAVLLMLVFATLAEVLGLELILGAFIAGALLSALDPDRAMTHPQFRHKLEAVGFGVFIPVFFVSSGLRFNLAALLSSSAALLQVPIFVLALLLVRGLPALIYRGRLGARASIAAGLLQATSLSFIVAAAQIGMELGVLGQAIGAALIAAGLVSVLLFPLLALILLGRAPVSVAEAPAAA